MPDIPRWRDPAVVGPPCQRPGCGHGLGLHDLVAPEQGLYGDEGCSFCDCGYALAHDLMTEVRLLSVWSNQVIGGQNAALYGWFRVFEGWTHQRAADLVRGFDFERKKRPSVSKRREKALAHLAGYPK